MTQETGTAGTLLDNGPVPGLRDKYETRMQAWRHQFHRRPEIAFDEKETAARVAAICREFGLEIVEGIGQTGVVATLSNGEGRSIALRADMDALPILELNEFPHRSEHEGMMHACGHDGHMAMLLGAAGYLAETRNFRGTVHFIFQPAEENEGGAIAMMEDGLFRRFPVEAVFGMHNWPGLPTGQFAVHSGPVMAAFDIFEFVIEGTGAHAAMPHLGHDCVIATARLVEALQTIVSRNIDPLQAVVVSVTQIHGGDAWNVLPESMVVRGCVRYFEPQLRDLIETRMKDIARGIDAMCHVKISVRYEHRYEPTINHAEWAGAARRAATRVAGAENVLIDPPPSMASEDFGCMLMATPGAYIWIGNGPTLGNCMLHNAHYDFNDDILVPGASYWVRLVEDLLAA